MAIRINDYRTGTTIRNATLDEAAVYCDLLSALSDSARQTGAVDGAAFGVDAPVWLEGGELDDDDLLKQLGKEATLPGDKEQAELCEAATAGDWSARAECLRALSSARAMDNDE